MKIFAAFLLVNILVVLCDGCADLDTAACQQMAASDPGYCEDTMIAQTVCPRSCGLCPVECFHCDAVVSNYMECQSTKKCEVGQRCLLWQVESSADGHTEYAMGCATPQVCDGSSSFSLARRKRNIHMHCCSGDLCNNPGFTTSTQSTTTTTSTTAMPPKKIPITTTPPTTSTTETTTPTTVTTPTTATTSTTVSTTTPSTTTTSTTPTTTTTTTTTPTTTTTKPTTTTQKYHACRKDIETLVEDSASRSYGNSRKITDFLKSVMTDLPVGPTDSLMGLSLFDSMMHYRWNFHQHADSASLLHALDTVRFTHHTNTIDYNDIVTFLKSSLTTRRGDRAAFDDVVIVFVDHSDGTHGGNDDDDDDDDDVVVMEDDSSVVSANLDSLSRDVIVVNIGNQHLTKTFSSLATNSRHVLSVANYNDLPSIKNKLLQLICG